ncbi:MAG: hypothetical protein CES88_01375 [Halobacteriovorax sp. JY17]|nr:MAG: hypothetical protein CES88_01375 [Halobacteriovorax sp. JY17]
MSEIEENLELKERKKFFLYKRSTLFNCIFTIFLFMANLLIGLHLRLLLLKSFDLLLLLSLVFLITFLEKMILRRFQYSLNKVGVLLIQFSIVVEMIYFILKIESFLN